MLRPFCLLTVPKVKFLFHTISHLLYTLLLTGLTIGVPWHTDYRADWLHRSGTMDPPDLFEITFWLWTLTKAAEELKQLKNQGLSYFMSWCHLHPHTSTFSSPSPTSTSYSASASASTCTSTSP